MCVLRYCFLHNLNVHLDPIVMVNNNRIFAYLPVKWVTIDMLTMFIKDECNVFYTLFMINVFFCQTIQAIHAFISNVFQS